MAAEKKPKKATSKKAKGSKVFDVAKPGKGKVDIGSKPMIVGHKSMASDPMMRDDKTEEDLAKEIEESVTQTSKVKIEPLSEDMKKSEQQDEAEKNQDTEKDTENTDDTDTDTSQSDLDDSAKDTLDTDTQPEEAQEDKSDAPESSEDKATDDGQDDASEPDEEVADSDSSKDESSDDDTSKDNDAESSDNSKDAEDKKDTKDGSDVSKDEEGKDEKSKEPELDPAAIEMERDENLRKIIESKKYRLNIKESSSLSVSMMPMRTKIIAAVVAVAVLLVGLFALIDTKTLDLGFELPFSIFGEEETPQQPAAAIEPQATEPAETVEASSDEPPAPVTPDFEGAGGLFAIQSVPSGWTVVDTSIKQGDAYEGIGFSAEHQDLGLKVSVFTIGVADVECLTEAEAAEQEGDIDGTLCPKRTLFAVDETNTTYLQKSFRSSAEGSETTYSFCVLPKVNENGGQVQKPEVKQVVETPFGCNDIRSDLTVNIDEGDVEGVTTVEEYFNSEKITSLEALLREIVYEKAISDLVQ